jgi:hypothetical protein
MLYNLLAVILHNIDKPTNDLCTLYGVSEEEDRAIVNLAQNLLFLICIFCFLFQFYFQPWLSYKLKKIEGEIVVNLKVIFLLVLASFAKHYQ